MGLGCGIWADRGVDGVAMLTNHHSPLTAHCSLLTAHYSPLTAHCSLLTAHYTYMIWGAGVVILTAHYSPLTTHHSPLPTHNSLDSHLVREVEAIVILTTYYTYTYLVREVEGIVVQPRADHVFPVGHAHVAHLVGGDN